MQKIDYIAHKNTYIKLKPTVSLLSLMIFSPSASIAIDSNTSSNCKTIFQSITIRLLTRKCQNALSDRKSVKYHELISVALIDISKISISL